MEADLETPDQVWDFCNDQNLFSGCLSMKRICGFDVTDLQRGGQS